jgi:hypothetical protein
MHSRENQGITWLCSVDGNMARHVRFFAQIIADSAFSLCSCARRALEQWHERGRMTAPTVVDHVTRRLAQALDMLDAAVERRIEIDRSRAVLTEQVHALDADRSKLAADLDAQLAKVRALEAANRDVAQRLDAAMENIRSVLETQA